MLEQARSLKESKLGIVQDEIAVAIEGIYKEQGLDEVWVDARRYQEFTQYKPWAECDVGSEAETVRGLYTSGEKKNLYDLFVLAWEIQALTTKRGVEKVA